MSFFVQTTNPPVIRGEATKSVATLYAGLLAVMVACQLFTFENFLTLFDSFNLPFGQGFVAVLPALIIVVELFAIPFLLRMYLSTAFRWVSMMSGWFAAGIWLLLTLWVEFTRQAPETIGFLGTMVTLMPGFWAVFMSFALLVLAFWASWGMWPATSREK